MNTFKTAAYGLIALAYAGAASAEITINFAASNGDRNATQTAIAKLLDNWTYRGTGGALVNQPKLLSGDVNTVARSSNFGTWRGTYGGQTVIIRTNYAGALAGIAAVAGDTTPRFDSTNGIVNGSTPATAGSGAIPAGNELLTTSNTELYTTSTVDFGLSTNYQKTSPFNGLYKGIFYNQISEEEVGISPLGFYASPGFPADNITSQIARQLYSAGSVPLSFFTGVSTDANKRVFAIGRNTDAGQRFAAQLEIGHGPGSAFVWKPTITGTSTGPVTGFSYGGTVTSHIEWPIETNSGITESGGFNGGATLAPALTATLSPAAFTANGAFPDAAGGYYIGYLTPGDADGRVLGLNSSGTLVDGRDASNVGVKLKFNGVENTPANVKSGRYTMWLYNRILRRQSGVADKAGDPAGFRAGFVNALSAQIKVDAGSGGGIRLNDPDLKVERVADGGIVYPID